METATVASLAAALAEAPGSASSSRVLSAVSPALVSLRPLEEVLLEVRTAPPSRVVRILHEDDRSEVRQAALRSRSRSKRVLHALVDLAPSDVSVASQAVALLPLMDAVAAFERVRPAFVEAHGAPEMLAWDVARVLEEEEDRLAAFRQVVRTSPDPVLLDVLTRSLCRQLPGPQLVKLARSLPPAQALTAWGAAISDHRLLLTPARARSVLAALDAVGGSHLRLENESWVPEDADHGYYHRVTSGAGELLARSPFLAAQRLALHADLSTEALGVLVHSVPDTLFPVVVQSSGEHPSLWPSIRRRLASSSCAEMAESAASYFVNVVRSEVSSEDFAGLLLWLREECFKDPDDLWMSYEVLEFLTDSSPEGAPADLCDLVPVEDREMLLRRVFDHLSYHRVLEDRTGLSPFVARLFDVSPGALSLWLDHRERHQERLFLLFAAHVRSRLEDSFGSDAKRWEIALGLMAGFEGSFLELAETAALVA